MTEDARAACCRVALEPPSAAGRLGCEAAAIVRSPRDPRCTGRQTVADPHRLYQSSFAERAPVSHT
jgi:hypothetical protein